MIENDGKKLFGTVSTKCDQTVGKKTGNDVGRYGEKTITLIHMSCPSETNKFIETN